VEDLIEIRAKVNNKLELDLVKECAPTLAGLKTANLFNYQFDSIDSMNKELLKMNSLLNKKGVYLQVLRISTTRALLYVYRPMRLLKDLLNDKTLNTLKKDGYHVDLDNLDDRCDALVICNKFIRTLINRIEMEDSFPHEIGFFLGYPREDVIGFIEQKGQNCKCCGFWKVYDNEERSKAIFAKYKKCFKIYQKVFLDGRTLSQLTVGA
jgi:hypothetical protein